MVLFIILIVAVFLMVVFGGSAGASSDYESYHQGRIDSDMVGSDYPMYLSKDESYINGVIDATHDRNQNNNT